VIPKHLHVVHGDLDLLNVFRGFSNLASITELGCIFTEVLNAVFENLKFVKNAIKLLESDCSSAFVLEELSLLHVLGELDNLLLKTLNVLGVLVLLSGNKGLDLLLNDFLDVLQFFPLLVDFVEVLDVVVDLGDFAGLEQEESLIELVDAEGGLV
jgi:hypothetical protein